MNRKRKFAIGLLTLTALMGLAAAIQMLTRQEDAPPAAVPVIIIIICAIGSLIAAVGLSRSEPWAILLGIGSRTVEALTAAPGIFAAPNGPARASAALSLGLSAAAILVLLALRKDAPAGRETYAG